MTAGPILNQDKVLIFWGLASTVLPPAGAWGLPLSGHA